MREYGEKLIEFLKNNRDDIFRTHRELCLIPAPSHFEDERAVYCKALLESFTYDFTLCLQRIEALYPEYDINDYDTYVEELNSIGLQEVLGVRQAQYDRYFGK